MIAAVAAFEVERVALRRVAPRSAAQRQSWDNHSVRSTRTGLSQRDTHHLLETETCRSVALLRRPIAVLTSPPVVTLIGR